MSHSNEIIREWREEMEEEENEESIRTIDIEIDLSKNTIANLALEAHKQDITLNEFCNKILIEYIKRRQSKNNDNI